MIPSASPAVRYFPGTGLPFTYYKYIGKEPMIQKTTTPLDIVNYQLESMAYLVEKAVELAIFSLVQSDSYLAETVIEGDKAINSFEIDIDNSTFNFLAVATGGLVPDQLRRIISIQKINPMLERIGDHAANIADAVKSLANGPAQSDYFSIDDMAEKCRTILHDAVTSFVKGNADLANDVLERDDDIDNRYRSIIETIKGVVLAGSSHLTFDAGLSLIRICKDLERIADLSMNIAEEAIYAIEGHVVKHGGTGVLTDENV